MDHSDSRNIADRYKGWMLDLIKEDLNKNTFPYAVCMENWQGDFNLGTLVRNANAFGAKEVFYVGEKKHWDRRSAVGTHHYTMVNYLKSLEDLKKLKEIYPIFIGVDNIPGSIPMEPFNWPKNCLLIFGEESIGLTESVVELCDVVVHIQMFGSVRSLNAGTASGIAMYDLVNKFSR